MNAEISNFQSSFVDDIPLGGSLGDKKVVQDAIFRCVSVVGGDQPLQQSLDDLGNLTRLPKLDETGQNRLFVSVGGG